MPVDQPVIWNSAAEAGIRLDAVLVVTGSPPAGGSGVFRGSRFSLSRTNAFPASAPNLVHDWPMRSAGNEVEIGANGWVDLQLAVLDLVPGETLYLSRTDEDDAGAVSAWATAISFQMESAAVSVADARESA